MPARKYYKWQTGWSRFGRREIMAPQKWLMDLEKVAELRAPEVSPEVPGSEALKEGKVVDELKLSKMEYCCNASY